MKKLLTCLRYLCVVLILCAFVLTAVLMWVYQGGTCFDPMEKVAVTGHGGTPPEKGDSVKIMSWNIQYFAGKNYVFYYDLPDFSGPDLRPSSQDIAATFAETVRVIDEERPDILMLQEVDEGAGRTDRENQTQRLQSLLKNPYPYLAETFYWKARYVPHPKIMGPVGMKLVILSRFPIDDAWRIALPQEKKDFFTQRLDLQRCLLSVRVKVKKGKPLRMINLHLEAFPEDKSLLAQQLEQVTHTLDRAKAKNEIGVAAGDFNLLSPGQYMALPLSQRYLYRANSEMAPLFKAYTVVPGLMDSDPEKETPWFTHFPNDTEVKAPDRTIDYIVVDQGARVRSKSVRDNGTLHISDHLPVMVTLGL